MSIVPKETIEVIAQSIGISNLSSDVAQALSPDVEYRLREIMQEAIKCMRHSKRTVLTTDDVDSALNLRNVEVLCWFLWIWWGFGVAWRGVVDSDFSYFVWVAGGVWGDDDFAFVFVFGGKFIFFLRAILLFEVLEIIVSVWFGDFFYWISVILENFDLDFTSFFVWYFDRRHKIIYLKHKQLSSLGQSLLL